MKLDKLSTVKVYIWDNLNMTSYYKNGIVIVAAHNLKAARKLAKQQIPLEFQNLIDKEKPEVLRITKLKNPLLIHYFSGND